ncbi:MAG TPA: metal/formaldehyde-sensitive transcriptional repressor [Bryobacteraceae bacterium]|jgi:DNA-binding FrmR family transcriptional regulator|nr:metal/formaldehyde-sensitive transcriptional repressor [Bryobacteraceae bacterium]
MSHIISEKQKLILRVRRLKGQLEAVERALEQEVDCSKVMHTLSACRGAMDALMVEVLEDHVRYHMVNPQAAPRSPEARAASDLIESIKTYIR